MTRLFDLPPAWQKHWRGMPAFNQADQTPMQSIAVHLRSPQDREDFAKLVGQKISPRTRMLWHPKAEWASFGAKNWVTEQLRNPRYPVYVISKGRWKTCLTAKALGRMHVPYYIVVEPQEYDEYASVLDEKCVLKLPFSNLGRGSIPARNWVWKHSLKAGAERHWILDDNIRCFYRLTDNMQHRILCGNVFRAAEDFVERYENVALAGFQYGLLVPRKTVVPPYCLNKRVYSCILIKNDLKHHWRGRYNEDTDLSLRVLKDGWCTVLFNTFMADKVSTMIMKGGNTDELYQGEGRLEMAESLKRQHPDVVKVVRKWGRWQHSVDCKRFRRNKLKLKSDVFLPDRQDEYGMYLERDEE